MEARRIKLLLVEDNPGDARLLQEYLREDERVQFELEHVERLGACLESLAREEPHVILVDLGLPDSQGLDTFTKIHEQAPDVPIVVMTGLKDSDQALVAVQAGAQDYLVKDEAGAGVLVRALQYAIQRKQAELVTRRHAENMNSVAYLGRGLAIAGSPAEIFESLGQGIQQLFPDIATLFISQYDPESKLISAAYGIQDGEPVDVLGLPEYPLAPEGGGTQSQVIRTRQPLVINADLKKKLDPKTRVQVGSVEQETQSALYVPMLAQEQVLGVIQVQSYTPERFQEEDQELLVMVGNIAAVALQNASLLETIQQELTERLRTEGELNKAQNVAHIGNWIWDIKNNSLEWSDEMFHIFGISKETFSGSLEEVVANAIHPEDRAKVDQSNQSVINQNKPISLEYRIVRPDGAIRTVWAEAGELELDQSGQPALLRGIIQDITDRVQKDRELQGSEEKYRLLFENVLNGFALHEIVLDEKGKPVDYVFLEVNKAFEQLTGKKREDLIDKRVTEALPGTEKDPADWIGIYGEVALTGKETRFEQFSQVLGKWFSVMAFSPRQNQFATVFEDITERVQAEEKLAASEVELRALFNAMRDIVLVIDRDGVYREIAPTDPSLLISPPENLLGKKLTDVFPAEQAESFLRTVRQVLKTGQTEHIEYELKIDDRSVWFSTTITPMNADSTVWVARDITGRVQAEAELQASEQKFRTLVEQLPAVVYVNPADDPSHTSYVSPQIQELLGYTQGEWLADPKLWSRRLHPEDRVKVLRETERIKETGEISNTEYRLLARDGRVVWIRDRVASVRDNAGSLAAWQGLMLDITERVQAEMALRESETKYRTLFENVPDGVYRTTLDGKILTANPALVDMLACDSLEELLQKSVYDFYPEKQDRDAFVQKVNGLDEVVNAETTLRRKDGELIVVLENFSAVHGADDQIEYYEGTMTDITEVKRAQEKLALHAEELERLQRATGSLFSATVLDIRQLASKIASTVSEEFHSSICSIFYISDGSHELERIAVQGPYSDNVAGKNLSLQGEGLIPSAIRKGQVINARDVRSMPEYLPNWEQARSELVIPLKLGEKVVGALDLQGEHVAAFNADDERLLSIYAERVVEALENTRLNQQTERQLERIMSLRAVDMAISSSFELNVVLGTLLEHLTKQLQVDAACVLLYNRFEHTLKFARGHGFRTQALKHTNLKPGDGYAGRALLENKMIYIADINEEASGLGRSEMLPDEGFVSYWSVPLVAKGIVKGVLEVFHRQTYSPSLEWLDFLELLAGQAAIAIDNAELYNNLQSVNAELSLAYDTTLEGWASALELRDQETEGHARRVTDQAIRLAEAVGLKGADLLHIRRGALLHDIGKMGVPDEILLKPGPLTDEEWVIMRKHPELAYNLLSPITYLRASLDIPYCHHEKWDGSGYPRGLKGEEIPLAARVFAIIDVWDALCSDRPYRKAWSKAKTLKHIREQAGTHFDPQVVDAFLRLDMAQ
jgi:PAS domain S-box-containing protein/putative nucleotidyltransferase with HDIG domain